MAVNDTYRLAPWADALYATDAEWWRRHDGVPSFTGAKWSLDHPNWATLQNRYPDIGLLSDTGHDGLELEPSGIRSGKNSGYAAINLAVHYGARRVLLLGYDMQARDGRQHFFGDHAWRRGHQSPFALFLRTYDTLVDPLRSAGVEVINCTPDTALRCFPIMPLTAALESVGVLA